MLLLKLTLVAAAVLLSSLASRRFGHALGGAIAGMPVIAGPIIGFVLWQEPLPQTRAIALATLACLPAAMVHMSSFAWAGTRWRWPVALLVANLAFLGAGALLTQAMFPLPAVVALAFAAPAAAVLSLPRLRAVAVSVAIPHVELICRVLVAVGMGWALMRGARALPTAFSGLLLAMPIAGNVLPCFTLPRYGAAATVSLVSGFTRGVYGFAAFFTTLYLALGRLPPVSAYALSWGMAFATALAVYGLTRRRAR